MPVSEQGLVSAGLLWGALAELCFNQEHGIHEVCSLVCGGFLRGALKVFIFLVFKGMFI